MLPKQIMVQCFLPTCSGVDYGLGCFWFYLKTIDDLRKPQTSLLHSSRSLKYACTMICVGFDKHTDQLFSQQRDLVPQFAQ